MIYEVKLKIWNESGIWCVVHVSAKSMEAAIKKALAKKVEETDLDLVCCYAAETEIELV